MRLVVSSLLLLVSSPAVSAQWTVREAQGQRFAPGTIGASMLSEPDRQPLVTGSRAIAGGWSTVANADNDNEIRDAAQAVWQQLPAGKAKLRRIEKAERQVVAGTNIRLILRLSNGHRWQATVWHKLDGSFEVENLSRVK